MILLYLLVSTRAEIGQFSGPYSPVRTAKILKFVLLQNCFLVYHQVFLTFIETKNLKLLKTFFYSKLCIKRFQIDSFCFRGASEFVAIQRE